VVGAECAQAQEEEGISISLGDIENDGRREEIQRYFGYEDLLYRYLTLPYDVSINTNQRGRYIDIGFALFALVPLLLLSLLRSRVRWFYVTAIGLIGYLLLCQHHSVIMQRGMIPVSPTSDQWSSYLQTDNKSVPEALLAAWYASTQWLTRPFAEIFTGITAQRDHITYPLLIILFIAGLWLISRVRARSSLQSLGIVSMAFGFLWLLLSAGIIWYGFFLLPFLYAGIAKSIGQKTEERADHLFRPKYLMLGTLVIWAVTAYVGRISNITYMNAANEQHIGKGIVDHSLYQYSTGSVDFSQSQQVSYPGIGTALEYINESDAYIYQLGTSMAFEIRDNPNRIFFDNTLKEFFRVFSKYRDKEVIMDIWGASDIQFLIVDLYTHTLDQTPEKSLTKKYQLLLNTLYQNPKVRLLATDRKIEVEQPDGSTTQESAVFGPKITNFGTYAIFEILS
ncbi:MAG: hypothetical protein AAFR14_08910, partial [Bacteroidota bacterium]